MVSKGESQPMSQSHGACPAACSLVCRFLDAVEGLTPGSQHGTVTVSVRQLSQCHTHGHASSARCWQCEAVGSSPRPDGLCHGLLEAYEFGVAEATQQ